MIDLIDFFFENRIEKKSINLGTKCLTMSNNVRESTNESQEQSDTMMVDQIDLPLEKIHHALELNKKILEHLEWKRRETLTLIENADFENETEDYDDLDRQDLSENCPDESYCLKLVKRKATESLKRFLKPYLCDERGLTAPLLFNPQHEFVLESSIQSLLINPYPYRKWSRREEKIIHQQVQSQYLFQQTRSKMKRMEEILSKDNRNPEDFDEINRINADLALMKNQHQEPDERFYSDIDWLVIAKHMSESDDRTDEACELYYNNHLHFSINHSQWTAEEDSKLLELIDKYGEYDWESVSKELNTGRLAWQCCARYQSEMNPTMKKAGPIVGDEANKLLRLIKRCRNTSGEIIWPQVAMLYEGRLISQIKNFYRKHNELIKNVPWDRLEDNIIFAAVKYYGPNQYTKIVKHLLWRNNRQIRERYICHLAIDSSQPDRSFGDWSIEEDMLLLKLCTDYVRNDQTINYSEIQREHFKRRNNHQLFARFHFYLRKLPIDFFTKPITENMIMAARTTRKLIRKKFIPPKLPEDRNELLEYIQKLSKQLRQQHTILKDDRNDLGSRKNRIQIESKNREKIFSLKILELNPNESVRWSIDDCLRLYNRLFPLARFFQRRIVYDRSMVIRTNNLLQTILIELIDSNVKKNFTNEIITIENELERGSDLARQNCEEDEILEFSSDHLDNSPQGYKNEEPEIVKKNSSDRSESQQENLTSPLTLDTLRFFISNVCCVLNNPSDRNLNETDGENLFSNFRCLFVPNSTTLFAFSLLRLMFHSMLIQTAQQNYDFDMNEFDKDQEFFDLRNIFMQLFLWPSLLMSSSESSSLIFSNEKSKKFFSEIVSNLNLDRERTSNQSEKIDQKNINIGEETINETKNSEKSDKNRTTNATTAITTIKSRGRPKKITKTFSHPINEFLKIRSAQKLIFYSTLQYNDLQCQSPSSSSPLSSSSSKLSSSIDESVPSEKFWITQPRSLLMERVEKFIGFIMNRIENQYQTKTERKNQTEVTNSKRNDLKRKSKRIDWTQIEPTRRSSRASNKCFKLRKD